MPVYQPFSHEELRIADYTAGRKFGTAQGQPGGFGSSTFGGFGATSTSGATGFGGNASTGGGLFGTSGTTGGGFGSNSTGTGFGAGSTGGLFGAKPAGTGLFGSTTTTTAQPSGGLFGTAGATGGFGSSTGGFGSGTSGGGLFGQQQQQQQNKPAFGFGQSATGTTSGFGANAATSAGGGLFGSSTTTAAPFGGGTSTGFGFGQQQQPQQQQGQTGGGLFGSGGFGSSAAAKPGGLFGSTGTTTTGGGLFGQQNQQQPAAGGGLFGNAGQQQQQTGGLFGAKPATGGGLFGSSTTGQTTGGLFGGGQQQQTGGGLFGSTATQQPSGGLFGAKPAGTGGGLFGSSTTAQQPATGGLFGGLGASQQQQQPQLGSSLFNSTFQQPQAQQPQSLQASLTGSVYGSPQLFNGLETPSQNLGPIATPLSSSQKARKQAIIPAYRINPNASSRLITPQKRTQGFGFSYSTYGTPGSAASNSSPLGVGNALLSGGRSLNKSFSSSNLRNSFSAQDSLLVPGAFTGNSRSSTGSLKRLNINRSLKVRSLFGPEEDQANRLPKKVSFDEAGLSNGSVKETNNNGTSTALVRRESASPTPESRPNGAPEMSEVNGSKGKELAVVQEESNNSPNATLAKENAALRLNQRDQKLGSYWMKPTKAEIEKSRNRKIKDFTVGREGGGQIVFSEADLTGLDLNDIFGNIVDIQIRRATVYPDKDMKPSPGKGLNVPSLITLENAWPRAQAGKAAVLERKGKRFEKHLERLKRQVDCEFVDYDTTNGKWTFRVQHYTTYGLDYGDDDDDTTVLSEHTEIATPTPFKHATQMNGSAFAVPSDHSMPSPPESEVDDTFEFKKLNSSNPREIPGQFDENQDFGDEEETEEHQDNALDTPMSFLDERSVGSPAGDAESDGIARSESEPGSDQEMAGSFPLAHTAEHTTAFDMPQDPFGSRSIMKASDALLLGTPLKPERLDFAADWTQQLQRTVSPKKQDRRALRQSQAVYMRDDSAESTPLPVAAGTKKITTSIDLMHSLFGQSTAKQSVPVKQNMASKGFEVR